MLTDYLIRNLKHWRQKEIRLRHFRSKRGTKFRNHFILAPKTRLNEHFNIRTMEIGSGVLRSMQPQPYDLF